LYPLGAETQEECAAACLREPECLFWTHNPNIGRCWLKKSDIGKGPSTKGSNSGQKSCGVTEDDILSGLILEDGCDCTSETTEACSIEENTKYSGHNLYTTKGIKVGNMAGCASLCFEDSKCKFWTYNPRVSKCWMKTSDRGRGPSTKGSVSGQKACGAPGALSEEPEQPEQTSGYLTSPNFPTANYPNRLHERKTIEVAKGNVIKIHFTDFDLERPDQVDYVDITDGDGSFLGRFGARHYVDEEGSGEGSGDEGPGEMIRISDITSNTETVHVLFHTDSTVTRSGWRLEWSSSPSPSGERELATSGVLTSPNFPERYLNRLDIVKKIQVPEGNTIRIRFTDFDCEPQHDTVTITDKDGTRLGLFDGMANSDDDWQTKEIISKTDTVEVLFHTDGSRSYTGWRLDWGMVGDEESRPKSGVLMSPNYPSRYPSNHDSTQTIEVAEGKTIMAEWTNFNTEPEYDYVQIKDEDGTYLTPKMWGNKRWGRTVRPTPVTSNSNIMHVKFHTDSSEQRTGWRLEWTEVSTGTDLLATIPAECPESWISLPTGCYNIIIRAITWGEAMTRCHQMDGRLVEIGSETENMAVVEEIAKIEGLSRFWIGLGDFDEEGWWAWYDHEDRTRNATFQAWGPNEPNNDGGHENCAYINSGRYDSRWIGKWNDCDCSKRSLGGIIGAICEFVQ